MNEKRTLFELSIDTRTLYDLLSRVEPEHTLAFTDMSEALGRTVVGADPNLQSALRRVENMDDIVFGNVRGVGYKRLGDAEIVQTGEREVDAVRRRARKAGRRITRIENFDALPNEMKVKHNTFLSLFGALTSLTKPKAVRRLESAVDEASQELPLGRTLEVFKQ